MKLSTQSASNVRWPHTVRPITSVPPVNQGSIALDTFVYATDSA